MYNAARSTYESTETIYDDLTIKINDTVLTLSTPSLQQPLNTKLKLATLELPTFEGDRKSWPAFWSAFQGITLSTSKMSEITHEVAKVFTKSRACPRKVYGGCRQFVEITCEATRRKRRRRRGVTAEVGEHVRSTVQCLPATLNRLENIKFEQLRDTCLNKVISYTLQGWPEEYSQEDTLGLAPYWEARSHLSVIESSLFTY